MTRERYGTELPHTHVERRRWSTRQRLVVLTFESAAAAIEWDEHPSAVKPWLSIPLTWDESTMAVLSAARDVIDEHDEQLVVAQRVLPSLCHRIERLRAAVHDAAQVARLRVVT